MNIGLAGHVDHGKTSLVKQLSGEWTDRHSEELKRGITMKLGYADTTFYKCTEKEDTYTTNKDECEDPKVLRKLSFVDCPGHETLMTVTLSGASIMDGALLVIAANEECPQPQTKEHLSALDIIGIDNIVIVQTKIDLVNKEEAKEHKEQIEELVEDTVAEDSPIIPVSSHHDINFDKLIKAIEEQISTPERDEDKPGRLQIARSFDVNKPGTEIEDILGGVIGGSLTQGELEKGDKIEIRPGVKKDGKTEKIETEITSLSTENHEVEKASPGGLIGVQTNLDPSLTKGDNLIGSMAGEPGTLPPVRNEIEVKLNLLEENADLEKIKPLKVNENLVLNSGTATVPGKVKKIYGEEKADIKLGKPIAAEEKDKIAISRKSGTRWSLIGFGIIQ